MLPNPPPLRCALAFPCGPPVLLVHGTGPPVARGSLTALFPAGFLMLGDALGAFCACAAGGSPFSMPPATVSFTSCSGLAIAIT